MPETARSMQPAYTASRNLPRRLWGGLKQPRTLGEWILSAVLCGSVIIVLAKALLWAVQGYLAILATDGAMDALLTALAM